MSAADPQAGTGPETPAVTRYRRKAPEVEALHWDGYPVTATVIIDWVLANDGTARYHDGPSAINIDIPGGWITAVPGDWITRELGGGFWAWDEEAFGEAHEPADAPLPVAAVLDPKHIQAALEALSIAVAGAEYEHQKKRYKAAWAYLDALEGKDGTEGGEGRG